MVGDKEDSWKDIDYSANKKTDYGLFAFADRSLEMANGDEQ